MPTPGLAWLQADSADPWLLSLRAYLTARRFGTATAQQLWQAFSDTTGEDVSAWMQPWTYRPGYPVVTVTLGGDSGRDVLVSQVSTIYTGSLAPLA